MPSVNLSPAGSGVDVVIRYITRAGVRVDTRNRLYEMILDLMHFETPPNSTALHRERSPHLSFLLS